MYTPAAPTRASHRHIRRGDAQPGSRCLLERRPLFGPLFDLTPYGALELLELIVPHGVGVAQDGEAEGHEDEDKGEVEEEEVEEAEGPLHGRERERERETQP
eukprot:7391140-Prymnesium_polylepis.2